MNFKKNLLLVFAVAIVGLMSGCAGITNNPSETSVVIVGMSNSKAYGTCLGCDKDVVNMKGILSPYSKHVTVLTGSL